MITEKGEVIIDTEVIAKYAGTVAVECFGVVGMAGSMERVEAFFP